MLNKLNNDTTQTQLLNVQEAANYLGVHVGTIRRWAYSKQLKGKKIGSRGDWRFTEADLEALATPGTDLNSIEDNSHFVQFYEDDDFLGNSIQKFLDSGDMAIVVAAPNHKEKLEKSLRIAASNATHTGEYICLDADEMLAEFMINGMPDRDLFFEIVGGLISRTLRNKKKLRVFGEMVALLWAEGNQEGAVKLEELWNELQRVHVFSLFCAYPINGFRDKSDVISFAKIEQTHSHVIPSESYTSLTDNGQKLRQIAILQQKAVALESKVIEHKKTEAMLLESVAALKTSEEFNRRIIENSADCIKVLDLSGHLISMNQPGCKAFEIEDFSSYSGQDYREFWKDGDYINANIALETASLGGIGRFQGFCPTAKGTPKWWDVVITPIYNRSGLVDRLLAISRDITSFKELEQRKEDFLSATSHELKTPLTSQKAFIQLLQKEMTKSKDDKYLRFVSKINEQTDKLMKLVSDLLDVSKVMGGKLVLNEAPFNLNECVKESVDELQTITDTHSITLQGEVTKKVIGDKDKISQVVVNLLTNAIKYSPEADKINVILNEDSRKASVSVQDFGIGIDMKDQDKIYDRFFRVSDTDEKTYPGLGMGLYIAAEIIKQHGGQIEVQSEKGKGSIFSFSIPFNIK